MRNVFLTFSISNSAVTEYFLQLSNALAKEFSVIIITDRIAPHPFYIDPLIIIYKWPSSRPTKLRDLYFILKLMIRHKPELTISLFGSVNMVVIAGFIMRIPNRIAWARTLSSQFEQNSFNVVRKKIIYKMASMIVVNSSATKLDTIKVFDVAVDKIKVLPNAVVNYFNDFSDIAKNSNKIIYAGRLHSSKGVDVLIKAFNILHVSYPKLFLDILGNGPIQSDLELLPSKTASKNINFKGKFLKMEVLKAFRESFCVIIPSNSEAFGFTVIESMSMKTCTIGADNTGIKEIIKHGESGLLFKTGDAVDLARKIESVYVNVDFQNRLAEKGYVRYKKFYSTDVAIARDYEFFKNLLCKE